MSLGLSFKVSPDMAESLRNGGNGRTNHHHHHQIELSEEPFSTSEPEQQEEEEDDWDEILPLPKPIEIENEIDSANKESEIEDGDNISDSDDDDDISLTTPPPSLPLVVVDLKKLCGYLPSSNQEREELQHQVEAALLKDEDDAAAVENDNDAPLQEQEQLSYHFEERVGELLDNGMAHHSDTLVGKHDTAKYAVVEYPEFYCRRDGKVVVTAREWKRLLKPHGVAVVNRLLQHLQTCNRVLSWKLDMHQQLLVLAEQLQQEKQQTEQQCELQTWRTETRRTKLDKLYQVRETFDGKLELARSKLEHLQQEQEAWVQLELRRLGLKGVDALDFDSSTIYAYGDTATGSTGTGTMASVAEPTKWTIDTDNDNGNDDNHDDGYVQSQDEESLSDDLSVDDDDDDFIGDNEMAPLGVVLPSRQQSSSAARRTKTRRLTKRRQQAMENQAEEARRLHKMEQARAEQESICALYPQHSQIQMARAVVQSLELRLQQVDDLLESLQEEEWADEEEEEEEGVSVAKQQQQQDNDNGQQLSLLDQVLAMILGALPRGQGSSTEEHYKYVREQHDSIKKEWKDYFGKLPMSLTSSTSSDSAVALPHKMQQMSVAPEQPTALPEQQPESLSVHDMRSALGIVDVEGDWDEDGNNDDNEGFPDVERRATNEKPTKVGLRPGGKVKI